MGHYKRGRAKNRRAGCLFCKPHKANGAKGRDSKQEVVAKLSENEQVSEAFEYDEFWYWSEDDGGVFENDCDCSDCVYWEDNLADAPGYEPKPLSVPFRFHLGDPRLIAGRRGRLSRPAR